ncbi:lysophospholipase L1-like esterase [Opitutaceae bacterium TAV1]|nr:lysophospholipase L1-like esterase [Opitutaceae bacterium TAV1]
MKTKIVRPPVLLIAATLSATFPSGGFAASLLKPDDRIVLVGDSITGQGANVPDGWIHLMENALRSDSPENRQIFVALGGSGQGAGTWLDVEKRSRTQSFALDVRANDVKSVLEQPADVLIIMLGMNDALFPRVQETPESYARWTRDYTTLIRALRARISPRVLALATPTLCTEDFQSPKNRVLDEFSRHIVALAKEENCVVLPTREAMTEMLDEGRRAQADFHVTADFVHPNHAGHVAVASGMLRGLGETQAAGALLKKHAASMPPKNHLSWKIEYPVQETDSLSDRLTLRLRSFRGDAASPGGSPARLNVPAGWSILSSRSENDGSGDFLISGKPEHLTNTLVLSAGGLQAGVSVAAPWLIGTGNCGREGWVGDKFDPARQPAGAATLAARLSKGKGFGEVLELAPGKNLRWRHYLPGVNYGGGDDPGAVDMAGVSFFQNFDVAWGARWMHADSAQAAFVRIRSLGFVNGSHLSVWLNGKNLFAGQLAAAPDAKLPVALKAGWNALVFQSNNYQVQWQFAIDLLSEKPDALRVSTMPPDH